MFYVSSEFRPACCGVRTCRHVLFPIVTLAIHTCNALAFLIWQLRELKLAKKVLGKQWFQQAAASRHAEQDLNKIAAEKVNVTS